MLKKFLNTFGGPIGIISTLVVVGLGLWLFTGLNPITALKTRFRM